MADRRVPGSIRIASVVRRHEKERSSCEQRPEGRGQRHCKGAGRPFLSVQRQPQLDGRISRRTRGRLTQEEVRTHLHTTPQLEANGRLLNG